MEERERIKTADEERPLLTVPQLAACLRVRPSWVYGHTRIQGAGSIPRVRVGRYLRFNAEEVFRWLRKEGGCHVA
jgi:predicted DNA-binding transcriptional regulator AlpA